MLAARAREDQRVATSGDITRLLHALRDGDAGAFDALVPLVYDELRRVARRQLYRHKAYTLDTTALVHEVYLKMARQQGLALEDRGQFLAVAARAMKQVIIQFARARAADKRGGGMAPVTLQEGAIAIDEQAERLLDVGRALERLRVRNERLAQVVECRFFAGLSEEETAQALGVSLRTAQRDWLRARAWLQDELSGGGPAPASAPA
jgi:RNA polymerase sigma factor (TIGR02999 family)